MDTPKKLSFFEKIYLSITDFRFYPYVLKTEKLSESYKYFLKLILLLSLIIAAYTSSFLFDIMDSVTTNFDVDDPYKKQTIETSIGEVEVEFPKEYSEDELTLIVNEYKNGGKSLFKVITFATMYAIIFFVFLIMKMLVVSIAAVFTAVICAFFKMKTNTENYYKLAVYALTLSFIVETASIVLVGGVKDYTIVSEFLLSVVYIFYAVRAIKFDAFLLIMKSENKKSKKEEENTSTDSKTEEKNVNEKKETDEVKSDDENR